ncbi:hypothetical protein B0H14DRAFT_163431 [Mycena olivaceomarginata]|nr:hypothetical protein B0H14DRAFT_163431 [Mycena olivaceomarginata]
MSWFRRRKRPQKHTDDTGRANSSTLPQELVDEFLSYLDDPTDLRLTSANLQACALVCRSWSTTAQRLLFKMVYLYSTHRFRRLEKTLRSSLHLVPHIRTPIFDRGLAEHVGFDQAFEKICQFPFTHLESVDLLHLGPITPKSTIALQQLFSLPTLRRIDLNTASFEPLQFPALWARCSSSIRHLQLRCRSRFGSAFRPTLRHSAPIALASLRLDTTDGVDEWLHHDLCPFDFSRLAVLSVTSRTTALRRPRMAAALKTIEALELNFGGFAGGGEPINLSRFSNLHFLRIHFSPPSDHKLGLVLESLSTLTSASPIRQIVMHSSPSGWSGEETCDPLDAKMAGLELAHLASVGLEMNIHEYTRAVPFFPRLRSKNLLSRTDDGWFERHIRRNESLG